MSSRSEINVTPMIDVMLVLLIIFMIVTPAIVHTIAVPRSENAEVRPEEPGEIVLSISQTGEYLLGTTGGTQRAVSREALAGELTDLYATRTLDRILFLKADSALSFATVEDAIETARRSGVRVIGAVTERSRKPMM